MDRQPSIEVGPYVLEIGREGGTVVRPGSASAEADADSLREALEKPAPKTEEPKPDAATEIDEAAEATAKVEKAVALCKGVAEGQALSPIQLALEVGSLLDCLEKLDRKKKHKKALRMARALATLLMLLKRWADLLQTLRIALRAGEHLGDLEAIGWARHELGSVRLAAGDVEGAARDLRQAREVREQIGDRRGLATTNRNLQVLCDRLQAMLRSDELVRRQPPSRRPPLRTLLAGATLAAFLFAGGVAAGMVAGGNNNRENAADEGIVTIKEPNPGGNGTTGGKGGVGGKGANLVLLTLGIAGEGGGTIEAGGFTCPDTCEFKVSAEETLTLVAHENAGWKFVALEGCTDSNGTACAVTMTAPTTVTATFEPTKADGGTQDGTSTSEEETTEEEPAEEETTSKAVE
jgi:hypothetical protein